MKCHVQNSLNYERANDLLMKLQTVLNFHVFEAVFFFFVCGKKILKLCY